MGTHLLSLDVEGAEEFVLETLGSIQVGVLLVEGAKENVCRQLRSRGMVQVATGVGTHAYNSIGAVPSEAEHMKSCEV